jgi:hypothetical protein
MESDKTDKLRWIAPRQKFPNAGLDEVCQEVHRRIIYDRGLNENGGGRIFGVLYRLWQSSATFNGQPGEHTSL